MLEAPTSGGFWTSVEGLYEASFTPASFTKKYTEDFMMSIAQLLGLTFLLYNHGQNIQPNHINMHLKPNDRGKHSIKPAEESELFRRAYFQL